MIQGYTVIVTNQLHIALSFFAGVLPSLVTVVDNEAEKGMINAMIINVVLSKRILIFHGPLVHYQQFYIYSKLQSMNAQCFSWGTLLESDYPNLTDLQDRFSLMTQQPAE